MAAMDSATLVKTEPFRAELASAGFYTRPFPDALRSRMLDEIQRKVALLVGGGEPERGVDSRTVTDLALAIDDTAWGDRMSRGFRVFSDPLSRPLHDWACRTIMAEHGRSRSAATIVFADEVARNPELKPDTMAFVWRCVRPGRNDIGAPHQDS